MGNHTSYDNPLIMPDTVLMQQRAGEYSKQMAEREPITRMPKQGGGVSFSNESSQDNPFNTIPKGFQAPQNHMSFAEESKRMKAGGGGVGVGNNTSGDNPLLTYNQQRPRGYEQPESILKPSRGGGISNGNHSSNDNPLHGNVYA